jgi:hypothetical protein
MMDVDIGQFDVSRYAASVVYRMSERVREQP